MVRDLWCTRCGAHRTFDTCRAYRSPDEVTLSCFRCGYGVFTAERETAPTLPGTWLLTPFDKAFLRVIGIARGTAAEVAR